MHQVDWMKIYPNQLHPLDKVMKLISSLALQNKVAFHSKEWKLYRSCSTDNSLKCPKQLNNFDCGTYIIFISELLSFVADDKLKNIELTTHINHAIIVKKKMRLVIMSIIAHCNEDNFNIV